MFHPVLRARLNKHFQYRCVVTPIQHERPCALGDNEFSISIPWHQERRSGINFVSHQNSTTLPEGCVLDSKLRAADNPMNVPGLDFKISEIHLQQLERLEMVARTSSVKQESILVFAFTLGILVNQIWQEVE
jgi:hypothetical protein